MGCDIHMYIEYGMIDKSANAQDENVIDITPTNNAVALPIANKINWRSFGGRLGSGLRNYWMFGALAGVRNDTFEHVTPRGLPDDLAYSANDDAWLYIDYTAKEDVGDGRCTEADAIRYQSYGCVVRGSFESYTICRRTTEGETKEHIGEAHKGKPTHVSHPDWHSHSWLTPAEFRAAINRYKERVEEPTRVAEAKAEAKKYEYVYRSFDYDLHAYTAIAVLLETLQKPDEGVYARIVFWFDN